MRMEFDFTKDMTMILKNVAIVFANQATLARQSSAEALKNPYGMSEPSQLHQIQGQSAEFLAAAAIWDKRAAAAALKGNLLMGPTEYGDPGYLSTFKELIGQCQKAGRVKIEAPLDRELNNKMAIPLEGVPEPLSSARGLAGIAGQTIGFDDRGNPIISR
jgi:hypothetical protein